MNKYLGREITRIRGCVRAVADDRGQAMVEFALVAPLLLMLVFGIVEFGRAWNARQVVTDAARAGARVMVASYPLPSKDSILSIVNTALSGAALKKATVQEIALTATCPSSSAPIVCLSNYGGAPDTAARVTIVYPHRIGFLAPIVGWTTGQENLIFRSAFVMRNE